MRQTVPEQVPEKIPGQVPEKVREKVAGEGSGEGSGAGSKADKAQEGLDSEETFSVALRAVGDFTCAYATGPPNI